MTKPPWVRIAIVTFNSGKHTQICLDALAAQSEKGFEVVIVDNGSTDGAIERLNLPDDRFTLKISEANIGFAGGSNLGLANAQTPFLMTINPDTSLAPDCLFQLLGGTRDFPGVVMFSPVLFKSDAMKLLDGAGDSLSIFGLAWRNGADKLETDFKKQLSQPIEVFSPTGAAALYRREVFENAGGFDSGFFCYLEDVDLALRLRAVGGKCMLIPGAKGVHLAGHSSDLLPGFALHQSVINNLNMIIKSAPLLVLPFMLSCHIAAHIRFQTRNKGTPEAKIRKKGFYTGLLNIPKYCLDRFRRQSYPLGASLKIAKALSWSIEDVKNRPLRGLGKTSS